MREHYDELCFSCQITKSPYSIVAKELCSPLNCGHLMCKSCYQQEVPCLTCHMKGVEKLVSSESREKLITGNFPSINLKCK